MTHYALLMNIPIISLLLATLSIIVAGQIGYLAHSQTVVNNTGLLPIPEFKPKPPSVSQQEAEQPQISNRSVVDTRAQTNSITDDSQEQHGQEQFITYRDPQGRFTIQYPSNWEKIENRSAAVSFDVPGTSATFAIYIKSLQQLEEE